MPELTDFSKEPRQTLEMYGVKQPGDGSFASNCLLARRLAERGVRFIQLISPRLGPSRQTSSGPCLSAARETDQASAALMQDLKQRGMLDDTLVIWGGEFGRTPMGQGNGRDHHILGFSSVDGRRRHQGRRHLRRHRRTRLSFRARHRIHVHDLHATMLQLCGIDHSRFSVKFQGLDAKLTGVEPCKVVESILA